MSWGTCSGACNNIHFDYPALMSDGRHSTDYRSACKVNNIFLYKNNIHTNYDYRQFLIKHSEAVKKSNRHRVFQNCGVYKNGYPYILGEGTPKHIYQSKHDQHQPYGYEGSDLKNLYLTREDLQSRMVAPLLSQQGYLTHYRPK